MSTDHFTNRSTELLASSCVLYKVLSEAEINGIVYILSPLKF